jgi:hypothetical protein
MKKALLFLLILLAAGRLWSQDNAYTVRFDGIGDLKLGMGKAELEKLLHVKFVLKHIHVDEVYTETVQAKYLGKDVSLNLMRSEDKVAILEGITVTDPLFKTADNTGIGTEQSAIVNKYEHDLLIMQPYADNSTDKNQTSIVLAGIDNYRSAIIFTMLNKKVISIQVAPTPQFRDRE